MYPANIQILYRTVNLRGKPCASYRIVVNKQHFKTISIDEDLISNVAPHCTIMTDMLPPLPSNPWNYGRISLSDTGQPYVFQTSNEVFPGITSLWHPDFYNFLSLNIKQRWTLNVFLVSSPPFSVPVVAKFGRYPHQMKQYSNESSIYRHLQGQDFVPRFLGYIKEKKESRDSCWSMWRVDQPSLTT